MKKLLVPLIVVPVIILGFLVYLVRSQRLPNPLGEIETDSRVLSQVIRTLNNLLGYVPEEEEKTPEEDFISSGYPAELFSFDVTQRPAVFGVVFSNPSKKTMVLRYIFPFERKDRVIESEIACPLSDSVIVTFDPSTRENEIVRATDPLYEIAEAGTDGIQGICGDPECGSIVARCELTRAKGSVSND